MISVTRSAGTGTIQPLDRVLIRSERPGTVVVLDGCSKEYFRSKTAHEAEVIVSGALGLHTARLLDDAGKEIASVVFRVECFTSVEDKGGQFETLLTQLHYTMGRRGFGSCLFGGRVYNYFVHWVRDHVHTLKGMKYFCEAFRNGMELYRDSQREDGMIFDLVEPRVTDRDESEERFEYGGFVRPVENRRLHFKRIPVENDVEFLYVEGIYFTWKATGNDSWMEGMLDSAVRAFEYSQTSPLRWSGKYKLLKRGFTIDTWDFQCDEDAKIAGDDIMAIYEDRTRFGIMHGDNTGFAASCVYLAEMLERVGRTEEAEKYRKLSAEIMERLNKVAWNGRFYTHHVPEDDNVTRDLGVDHSAQLSLSNAYGLNRTLTHEQCVSIIKEYMKIRENLPHGSPGEWYAIYPPFEWGFEEACNKWEYMNGGVTPIVAGELARGAFEHGFEDYGVDILNRIGRLADKHGGYLHCCFKGALPEPKHPNYVTLDLTDLANAEESLPGWTAQSPSDYNVIPPGMQRFRDIPFDVVDPSRADGLTCISLCNRGLLDDDQSGVTQIVNGKPVFVKSGTPGQRGTRCTVPVGQTATTLFFLHALTGNGLAGDVTLEYADGTTYVRYINEGREVLNWWLPREPVYGRHRGVDLGIAWQGKNHLCGRVGVSVYGMRNPHPEREIKAVHLSAAKNGNRWTVFGITLSDGADTAVRSDDVSFGIPDNWGAAAVVYALVEGLAGVVDRDTAFEKATVAPRWEAAGVDSALVRVVYPSSRGYVAYRYHHDPEYSRVRIELTGSGHSCRVHCLLPKEAMRAASVEIDGESADFKMTRIEESKYVDVDMDITGVRQVDIEYETR